MTWSLAATLLLLSGDVELNPGPKKGAPKDTGPTPEQKIAELETTVKTYEEKISGLEKDLETTKSESKTKMETLESQMTQVTADLATLKENDKNDELSKQLSQIQTDLDQKLSSAETNLEEFRAAFAKFQNETVETQSDTGKKLADVDSQIKSFVSSSQGSVQDVMSDAESLKGNYSALEQRVKDIKVEAQGKIQALLATTKEQRREYKSKFVDMDVEFARMRERLETMNLILDDIQEKMYEFEQNKKNNLILYGITTKHPETSESLRTRIANIFRDHLNIRRDIPVQRATRVHTGPEVRGCRPVLVTFETFKDRETVLRMAKVLKKANVIVTEDLSKRTRESRQELRKFMRQIKRINPEKVCYLEYDKLYVDHKIYVWNETLGQVIEHAEAERYGYGGMNDFMMSRPGTQMMNMNSRPPSQMSMGAGMHPKSASSIPRLPPLARAVSLATGMAQMDPRDEKLGELERIINNYQEKLDAVTTNYQEKVSILERKLVDKDIANGMPTGGEMSDVEVDRDEDMSPQPHNVQYNGKDGGYLEVPPDGMPVLPQPTNHSLPGSPQKKLIQPIMEKVVEEESSPVMGENSHTLPNNAAEAENNSVADR